MLAGDAEAGEEYERHQRQDKRGAQVVGAYGTPGVVTQQIPGVRGVARRQRLPVPPRGKSGTRINNAPHPVERAVSLRKRAAEAPVPVNP